MNSTGIVPCLVAPQNPKPKAAPPERREEHERWANKSAWPHAASEAEEDSGWSERRLSTVSLN